MGSSRFRKCRWDERNLNGFHEQMVGKNVPREILYDGTSALGGSRTSKSGTSKLQYFPVSGIKVKKELKKFLHLNSAQ